MNFLLLSDRFAFHPSATHICTFNLACELSHRGHSVIVVSIGRRNMVRTEGNGITIITFANFTYHTIYCDLEEATGLALFVRKIFRKAIYTRMKVTDWAYTDAYANAATMAKISRYVDFNEIDTVISFSEPFSTHLVGKNIKDTMGSSIKWVAYEMDPFALNYNRSKDHEVRNRNLEVRTLESADLIVLADGIMEENRKRNHLVEYEEKSLSLPIPALVPDFERVIHRSNPVSNRTVSTNHTIKLIYTGIFYPLFRTPNELLNILSEVDFDFELHIYGDVDERIYPAFKKVREKCVFHGRKSQEECVKACENADILIDIQNDIPNQVPSKLFSYMSINKPIISFYSPGCDVGIRYLDNYRNALCIKKEESQNKATIESFKAFCTAEHHPLDRHELQKCLEPFTTEYITDQLIDAVATI